VVFDLHHNFGSLEGNIVKFDLMVCVCVCIDFQDAKFKFTPFIATDNCMLL